MSEKLSSPIDEQTPEAASKTPHPGGRPRDPEKHQAILRAARKVFFTKGLGSAAIEEIAQRAGVSKVTIYNRFGDKPTLFEAVVKQQSDSMSEMLIGKRVEGADLKTRLNGFGEALLAFLFDPDHVSMERILAQDLAEHPGLAHRFFAVGPGQCRERLANVLAEAAKRGELTIDNPIEGAEDLLSLWKGFADLEFRLHARAALEQGEIAERVARGTDKFLQLYQTTG
ncbi:TetR/AcrR family transcriptional regulator [Alterisphingorhabdus coralli]|uniref:TetR/AcrR family transcriptional regulator n=1 Tax=Alterisphingorhabdus coralli TaxID=3071408 RepID=A0AA97F5S5_9SPHN|nr:TetR/AcrR family transcriptional regulator [Parasphingorhabdus sp. SCSIO 66989]WOE74741.1 TetR/AcrR family transcriptional regulator [Parasphingorhabdus sp. SCSIO 66989]